MELCDRHKQILDILRARERVSTSELSRTLYVCEMTIRRDLQEMERRKLLTRYHGGAMLREEIYPVHLRRLVEAEEKKRLAKKAAEYLRDNQVIFLDGSSTCSYIIPHLEGFRSIRVVTNSIDALLELSRRHIPCAATGGTYQAAEMCLVGSDAEEFLRNLNPDIAFCSSLGITEDGRITDIDAQQTAIRRIVLKNSARTVFLFDSTKRNKTYPYTLCHTEDTAAVVILP